MQARKNRCHDSDDPFAAFVHPAQYHFRLVFAKGYTVLTLAEAVQHFAHLFVRAFVCSYSFLGTSPGGLAAQVLTILTTEVQGGWWRPSAWRANWQGGLKRAVYTLLVVWAVTFAVCSVTTFYYDRQNLTGRLRAVVHEKDELKNGLAVRDRYIQQLSEENTELRAGQTPRTRTSAPTVIDAPGGIPIVGNHGIVDHPTVNNNFVQPNRVLDDRQRTAVRDMIQSLPDSIKVFVKAPDGNGEVLRYAQAFQDIAVDCGKSGNPKAVILGMFWRPVPVGLMVVSRTDVDVSAPFRDQLVEKLNAMNVPAEKKIDEGVGEGQLYIVVGEQPPK